MRAWKLLEHTADLALEGAGNTPEEALRALCEGLLAQIAEPAVRPVGERLFRAEGADREEAVVALLGDLLFAIFAEGWLPARCEGFLASGNRLEGKFMGEPFDPARHRLSEVKAATYHDFSFARDAEGLWRLRVIFDV